jgi:hypothetical protein
MPPPVNATRNLEDVARNAMEGGGRMAAKGRLLEAAKALMLAGFLAGCSGGVAGLMDAPPAVPDASGSSPNSAPPATGADASRTANDAPAVETGPVAASDAGSSGADGDPVAPNDVAVGVADSGLVDDASPDSGEAARPSCLVTFTVADAWVDGVVYQNVALGGDVAALGAWSPAAAVPMTQVASGTWTVGVMLTDGVEVEFLFVKRGSNVDSWESWTPDSDRSLVVACSAASGTLEGGTVEGGSTAAGPVVGVSYAGNFGVQPPDAVAGSPGSP